MNENSYSHFKKNLIVMLTLIFVLGYANATVYGVSFPDYFPLDAASHGLKTFQWTHGRTGSYQSYISGTLTVPYTSGAIEGTGIVNMSDLSQLYATNDGSEVKWIAFAIETELGYISTDCSLADHPASWTFSTVTDDMLLDQGTYYFVDPSLTPCEMDNKQSLLFDIQDVSVPFGQYDDAVIIWWLDEQYSFTALDFSGKDIDLGITLPNGTQTGEHSVTAFDVYAYGIGMIAGGDIEAEFGELIELTELVDIDFSDPVVLLNDLIQQVIDLELHHGFEKSLLAKLDTALQKLQDGNEANDKAAVNSLTAFINAINAQSGNKISEEDANSLITAAQQIIDMISSE